MIENLSKNDFDPYCKHSFKIARVKKVVNEARKIKSLYIETNITSPPIPGQFLMVWLPGAEEIPISISDFKNGIVRLTIANVGLTTSLLSEVKIDEKIFYRGPYGNGFNLKSNSFYVTIGGGYGVAPLVYAIKKILEYNSKAIYIIGAETKSDLLFIKEIEDLEIPYYIATEDGSIGYKGVVTDLFKNLMSDFLKDEEYEILTCGPEKMMAKIVEIALKNKINVQACLERYMKCGFGICGSCVLEPLGLRVCLDGPVFNGKILEKTFFGKETRSQSGSKVRIDK
ncbi:MAG: dihydroorotate dehydrogenase electron transfer subunit [Nitrososphaerota archaeon]